MKKTIYLVDDHQLVIDGLVTILSKLEGLEILGHSLDGKSGLRSIQALKPDLALLDLDMPEMNGLVVAEKLRQAFPAMKIAILTMHNEKMLIEKMIKLGVDGFFIKNMDTDDFLHGIKSILAGKQYYSSQVTLNLAGLGTANGSNPSTVITEKLNTLSDREKEILTLIALGKTNKEIGEELFISHRTVDAHRNKLMSKLEARNIAGLIRFAIRSGLVD